MINMGRTAEPTAPKPLYTDDFSKLFMPESFKALVYKHYMVFMQALTKSGRTAMPGWAMMGTRTGWYDSMVKKCVDEQGMKQVLILGSGCDCRPLRLELDNKNIHWVEVDEGAVIDYKLMMLGEA